MKILILSQYFWPESFIINDIVRILNEQGHEVIVATGKPNYPDGKIFAGYRAAGAQREYYLERIEVLRVPLWPRRNGGGINLALNYLSFVLSGLLYMPWMLRKQEFDTILIFGTSPITQAIPAILLKCLRKVKVALWVQDLWPESLSATGFVQNLYLLRAVGWMVRGIYSQCDTVLVQSRAFFDPVSKYVDRTKIRYYPNSMDVRNGRAAEAVPDELALLLEQHFCVVFAGNLGTAQALDTLVKAAEYLRSEPHIRLVLVGSGSRLAWVKSQQQALDLYNLIVPGRFAMETMPEIFRRASALLVSLTEDNALAKTVPSKLQAYLAAGKPIIGSLNGEGARVILDAQAGFVSAAEQALPLAKNIIRLKQLPDEERISMGLRGLKYFEQNYEMTSQVKNLVDLLSN